MSLDEMANQARVRSSSLGYALRGYRSTLPFTNQSPKTICIPCLMAAIYLDDHPASAVLKFSKGILSFRDAIREAGKLFVKSPSKFPRMRYAVGFHLRGQVGKNILKAWRRMTSSRFKGSLQGPMNSVLGGLGLTAALSATADVADEFLRDKRDGKPVEWDRIAAVATTGAIKGIASEIVGDAVGAGVTAVLASTVVGAPIAPVAGVVVKLGVSAATSLVLNKVDETFHLTDKLAHGLRWFGNKAKDVGSGIFRKTRRFFGRGGDSG